MPRLEINKEQIEKLIDQLAERDKIQLIRKLEAKTLPARWKVFLRQIDGRHRRNPISQREIEKIVEEARQEVYERNRR